MIIRRCHQKLRWECLCDGGGLYLWKQAIEQAHPVVLLDGNQTRGDFDDTAQRKSLVNKPDHVPPTVRLQHLDDGNIAPAGTRATSEMQRHFIVFEFCNPQQWLHRNSQELWQLRIESSNHSDSENTFIQNRAVRQAPC